MVIHPALGKDAAAEAEQVVAIIRETRQQNPHGTIAVLVRGRSHLAQIVPALRAAALRFRAIDIERLDQRPVVRDLLSLTRALLHPADRVAWLACLRAPWCGLTLGDLELLVAGEPSACVWDLINQPQRRGAISRSGQQRLSRVVTVLGEALRTRRRRGLRAWLEAAWLALGGAACAESETDLDDAEVFFKLIDELDRQADLRDIGELDERLQKLFALPDVEADERLQLMTIHKSKGLEFDTVILPGLHRASRRDDPPLLMWMERVNDRGQSDLLLAPIKATGRRDDATYNYLRKLDKGKEQFELGRVFYVAATRAKRKLHLLGQVEFNDKKGELRAPASGSLLSLLWPQVKARFESLPVSEERSPPLGSSTSPTETPLRRLASSWQLPQSCGGVFSASSGRLLARASSEEPWAADNPARHIGTVVHQWLQKIAEEGVALWGGRRIDRERPRYIDALRRLGVAADRLEESAARVVEALTATLDDERGRWILSDHHDAHCEYALSGMEGDQMVNLIIDRVFVDDAGVCWIIDYKTSGGDVVDEAAFMDAEQEKYRTQLERYAAFMSQLEARPIMMALYFPLFKGWRQWRAET